MNKTQGILLIAITIAISIAIMLLNPVDFLIKNIGTFGYLGVFLVMALTSATIFFPVPGLLAVFALGAVLNPLLLGVIAGIGSALGEFVGYAFGYGGQEAVSAKKGRIYKTFDGWMKKNGFATIFIAALLPAIFDIAGIAAGALRYSPLKFFTACALGKIVRCVLSAYFGSAVAGWLF